MSFITGVGMEAHTTQTQAGSTVPRRQLGRYLRELRTAAGLTVRAAAKELERSEPTMWRIESGLTSVRSIEVGVMCGLYRADENLTKALTSLAKETKAKGWWQSYGDVLPEWFDLYVGLEAAANRISWYESELVPGLFQTEEYARALTRLVPDRSEAEVERRVQLRMERQAILRRPIDPPAMKVAISETVIVSPAVSPDLMAAQLRKLAEVSELPNVEIRIVPFSAGLHRGKTSGPFEILRFPLNGGGLDSEPPTVYTEMVTGALYLDKPDEIARYDRTFENIWNSSLAADESRTRIQQAAKEMQA